MSDFGWALEQMQRGLRVKRQVWREQCIQTTDVGFHMLFDADERGAIWSPSYFDLLATDWRVELLPGEGVQERLPLVWR